MIFDSIILKLKGIMYLVYCVVSKIHLSLFIIAENCYVVYKSRITNPRDLVIMVSKNYSFSSNFTSTITYVSKIDGLCSITIL